MNVLPDLAQQVANLQHANDRYKRHAVYWKRKYEELQAEHEQAAKELAAAKPAKQPPKRIEAAKKRKRHSHASSSSASLTSSSPSLSSSLSSSTVPPSPCASPSVSASEPPARPISALRQELMINPHKGDWQLQICVGQTETLVLTKNFTPELVGSNSSKGFWKAFVTTPEGAREAFFSKLCDAKGAGRREEMKEGATVTPNVGFLTVKVSARHLESHKNEVMILSRKAKYAHLRGAQYAQGNDVYLYKIYRTVRGAGKGRCVLYLGLKKHDSRGGEKLTLCFVGVLFSEETDI